MSSLVREQYRGVLDDLESRKQFIDKEFARLRQEQAQLEALIDGIRRILQTPIVNVNQNPLPLAPPSVTEQTDPETKFKGLSIRWAILKLLAMPGVLPMSIAEVTDALRVGGIAANPEKLRSNAGAVLSLMGSREEVSNTGNSYSLTALGLDIWRTIQRSPKYLNRMNSAPGEELEVENTDFQF